MIEPERIRVQAIPAESSGMGLHYFQVLFGSQSGRCFITSGEANYLRELTTDWVKRALVNLGTSRGAGWLQDALVSEAGLMLHHCDAYDRWGMRQRS